MSYKAILFDLDGTLVPMEMRTFSDGYMKELHAKLVRELPDFGLSHGDFVKAMWTGVASMVKNNGTRTNLEAFWETFEALTGVKQCDMNDICLDFYGNEFQGAKRFTEENPLAARAVELARQKADKVILATNPLFPMCGQITRMSWVELKPEDFDMVTAYEDSRCCKPNPMYYENICKEMGLDPKDCLMIGNDENEDMNSAASLGMDAYLVTDCMIPAKDKAWEGKRGTFKELVSFLEEL